MLTNKQKVALGGAVTAVMTGIGAMLFNTGGSGFVPPAGSLTDCGASNGSFQLHPEVTVTREEAQTKGKLRWGPCYGVSDGTNGCHSGQQAFGSPCTSPRQTVPCRRCGRQSMAARSPRGRTRRTWASFSGSTSRSSVNTATR